MQRRHFRSNSFYPTTSDLVTEIAVTEAAGGPTTQSPTPGGGPTSFIPKPGGGPSFPKTGGGGCIPHPITILLHYYYYDQKEAAPPATTQNQDKADATLADVMNKKFHQQIQDREVAGGWPYHLPSRPPYVSLSLYLLYLYYSPHSFFT